MGSWRQVMLSGLGKEAAIMFQRVSTKRFGCVAVAVAVALGVLAAPQTFAADEKPADTNPAAESPASRPGSKLNVGIGRSSLIKSPLPAKTVTISDPKIADVQILSPTQLLIAGKAPGTTDLVVFDAQGQAEQLEIVVSADRTGVLGELQGLFPGSKLALHQSRDTLVITGVLPHVDDVTRLRKYMDLSGMKYADMTTIPGVQQVQIKVMVAEANRVAIRALGINSFFGGHDFLGGSQIGPDVGGALNPISIGTDSLISPLPVNPSSSLFGVFTHSNIAVFVQALAENQYLRVLAEPNLVALSGEEASFLAGGEFPIPIVQGAGASTTGVSLSIEYKKFGVQLKFRPTVTGDGTIRLHVAPEVSELSNTGAITLQGFSIPGLLTRRAETTVELKSGQSFGMAGLISQSTQARSSRVPGLGDLPVLGSLFRSVRYKQGNTELVLLVTASLVEPTSAAERPPVPSQFYVEPNDWELYALGRTEGAGSPRIAARDAEWLKKSGLDRLRGPGAWASYESRGAVGAADTKAIPEAADLVSPDAGTGPTTQPAPQPAPAQ